MNTADMKTILTLLLALFTELALAQGPFKDTNGQWGVKNADGRIVVAGRYETEAELKKHDLLPGIEWGFYNKKGERVMQGDWVPELKGTWTGSGDFSEDRAAVICKGKKAYIDKKGKLVTGFTFAFAEDFKDGKARVRDFNTGEDYYIDKKGKRIQEEIKGENVKSFTIYVGSGIYKGKKVKYQGETKYRYGSLGWGVNNKYADGKGIGEIEDIGTYNGQWSGNVPHGKGTMQLKNGETFTGNFVNGTPQGAGTYYSNKGTLTGNFAKGEKVEKQAVNNRQSGPNYLAMQGSSTATYKSGKYEGQMTNGIENGTGRFTYTNGAVYEGQWKNGLPDGSGKMVLKNGTTYHGTFTKGYFTKGKIFKYLRDVQGNEVIPYLNNLMVYVKGWIKVTKTNKVMGGEVSETVDEIELSSEVTWSPDEFVEVLGLRDDKLWYGGFVNKQELASAGKTVENTSTYGYQDSKKSANVVVNTTTKTDVPATYRTVRVPAEGCDENGYKTRLPLDRSKFSENHMILSHELVLDKIGSHTTALPTTKNNAETLKNIKTNAYTEPITFPSLTASAKKLKFKLDNQNKVEYIGEVKNENANGYGEAKIYLTKDIYRTYKGYWKNNLQHGKGILYMGQRDKYEGDFVNGKWHGKGTLVCQDYIAYGYTYVGDFQNSNITGYGRKTYKDGRIEEGYFDKGVYKGKQP